MHQNELSHAECLKRAEQAISEHQKLIDTLAAAFKAQGHSLYLVGGSVRDALLGRLSHDFDFTTDARPDAVLDILNRISPTVWDTGIEYGTISAELCGQTVEITTFRSDVYDGDSRNPEVQFGDTLEGDLIRRDFRVNAMALDVIDMQFKDPLGGLDDLVAKVIDTPAAPELSFHDDPLRMLRGARFVSQLGFELAPRVAAAMREMHAEISRISVERVQEELNKLISGDAPRGGIEAIVDAGLADIILPEIPALRLTMDGNHRHKDVYRHSLKVLEQAIAQEEDGVDLVLRWAALLHDVGKPATRAFDGNGNVSFHQHDVVGAKMVRKRLRALKYPKAMIADISQLVFLHMRFYGFSGGQWTDSAVRRYVTDAGPLLERLNKLVRADITTQNRRKSTRLRGAVEELEARIAEIAEKEDLAKVRPDLDGNEIMELLGLQPGPEVGKAWSYMKELRLERGPMEREEAIAALRAWWEEENVR